MKKLLNILMMVVFSLAYATNVAAQEADEPIITIKTNRYDIYGPDNNFQMCLMATVKAKSTNIEVDFGFGRKSFTVSADGTLDESEEEEVITGGTLISGSVSKDGMVRVYGNPKEIDYLDVHGSGVTDIDLSKMTEMSILELGHNEIKKLDLSNMRYLEYLDLKDNTFSEGLNIGTNHPYLKYLNVNQMGDNALATGTIDLSQFPALLIFTAWDSKCLKSLDVTKNERLVQLSVDNTGLRSIDTTHNPSLMILNVSDCGMNSIDISKNPLLVEFYIDNEGINSNGGKVKTLDFSNNPHLQRIFCSGNLLTELDISNQSNLITLSAANNRMNKLTGVDKVTEFAWLDISGNCFDFSNLPFTDPMTYFYYDLQEDLFVEKDQCVGKPLGLGSRLYRETTTTYIYNVKVYERNGFTVIRELVEDEDYTFNYKTCDITFLKPVENQVQCAFLNDVFDGVTLFTNMFYVRSEEDYGKPVEKMTVTPEEGDFTMTLGMTGTEPFYVDFGDGTQKEYNANNGSPITISGKATGTVRVLGSLASTARSLTISNQKLKAIDVTKLEGLQTLSITDSELPAIDLSWNNLLRSINLSGNALTSFDLTANNSAFNKNMLTDLNVSHNQLTSINMGLAAVTLNNVDASYNKLKTANLNDMQGLRKLDLSNNVIDELLLSQCPSIVSLNLANNELDNIDLSAQTQMNQLDLSGNKFTFANMPAYKEGYTLAPQKPVVIAGSSMTVDLHKMYNCKSKFTKYTWKTADGETTLTKDTHYSIIQGKTTFLAPAKDMDVYCEMTNEAFPEFTGDKALRTTVTHVVEQPKYTVASFTTPIGGQHVGMSLAATKKDSYIYIDWGDGELVEYALQDTYQLYSATTIKNAEVKIYSNDAEDGNMKIFSIDSLTVKNEDFSKMKSLYNFSMRASGLTSVDLSCFPKLGELNLQYNNLTSIDLSHNPELTFVLLSNNKLKTIDVANNQNIVWLVAAYNELESVDTKQLTSVFNIDLAGNKLKTFDATPLKAVGQLFLAQNQLETIDVSKCHNLSVLDLSANKFDFSTLPDPDYFNVFYYGNQAPLKVNCVNGVIDLSKQAVAHDSESKFYFFEGPIKLYEDADGNLQLMNSEYEEGTDFTCDGGIITFMHSQPSVTGLVVNELYPDILLYTETFAVEIEGDGIKNIDGTKTGNGYDYNLAGQRVGKAHKGITITDGKKYLK